MTIAGPDPPHHARTRHGQDSADSAAGPPGEPGKPDLALTLLARAFDYYLPVVGVNTAAFIAEIHRRRYAIQGGHSFAIQPPRPGRCKNHGEFDPRLG